MNKTIERLAILTLLIAIVFGILQYFGEKKFSEINSEVGLIVIAKTFVQVVLICFIIYLIGLSLKYSYKADFRIPFYEFFYDLGVYLTLTILSWTILIIVVFKIAAHVVNKIFIISTIIITSVLVFFIAQKSSSFFTNWLNEIKIIRKFSKINLRFKNKKQVYKKTELDDIKDLIKKSNKVSIIVSVCTTIIVFILGYLISYYFFLQSAPVILDINHKYDILEGRLYINVKNTHPLKNTGTIYLYKLEINPNKPEITNKGIGPKNSTNFSLTLKYSEANVSYWFKKQPDRLDFSFPAAKAFYVFSHESVSYKITCDNCPSEGFIKRIPDFGEIPFLFALNGSGIVSTSIPIYAWEDYRLQDIKEIK